MTDTVPVRQSSSVFDTLADMQNRIMQRAYEIFEQNGYSDGRDFENWAQAEREVLWKPPLELSEKDGRYQLEVAISGIEAKDIKIEATADDIVITGDVHHRHEEHKGTVHYCEFQSGKLFRSIHLPQKIDPDKVKAEFKNGLLRLTAEISKESRARKITPEAA